MIEETSNPYASPKLPDEQGAPLSMEGAHPQADSGRRGPLLVVVGSVGVLCGFAAYIPILGLRGAAFCLFPGLAQRSIRLTLAGVVLGFLADFGVTILWIIVGGVWEPRWGGYNADLANFLPPDIMVATHAGSPMPNSMKFGLGLVLWSVTMYAIWTVLWRPKLELERRLPILAVSAILVGMGAAVLWMVAPLTVMGGGRYQPFGDLPTEPFLVVLFSTMPVSSLIVGILMHFWPQSRLAPTSTGIGGANSLGG